MAIKCIALDLDGTTLDKDGKLPEENRKEIEEAIAQGIEIVIASGRAYDTLPKEVLDIQGIGWAILPFYPAAGGGQGAVGLHGRGKRQL